MTLAHTPSKEVIRSYRTADFFEHRVPVMQEWADYLSETMGPVVMEPETPAADPVVMEPETPAAEPVRVTPSAQAQAHAHAEEKGGRRHGRHGPERRPAAGLGHTRGATPVGNWSRLNWETGTVA